MAAMNDQRYTIGQVADLLGLTGDTLRYYEKLGLLPNIHRTPGGTRTYRDKDLARLRFILRAKAMNFSLEEVSLLLEMRDDPQNARDQVRMLTQQKLKSVEEQLLELETLRRELTLLINLCRGNADGCPIIEDMDDCRV